MNISNHIYNKIKNHAMSIPNQECCGLLVENKNGVDIVPCTNIAENKYNNFCISGADYIKASKLGNIIASYHSHVCDEQNNYPSLLDQINSQGHKLPSIIYYLHQDKFQILDHYQFCRYIGRPFIYNSNDCLGLVEDYYANELQIYIPRFERNETTLKNNPTIILDNIQECNFINVNQLQLHDIIIINTLLGPTHLMIYVGNNQILHHRYKQYSTVEIYKDLYQRQTHSIFRHRNFVT